MCEWIDASIALGKRLHETRNYNSLRGHRLINFIAASSSYFPIDEILDGTWFPLAISRIE